MFFKTTTAVQNKCSFSLNDRQDNVMRVRVRQGQTSGSVNNELNVVNCVGLMCAYNFKDTSATPAIHPITCHCNISLTIGS